MERKSPPDLFAKLKKKYPNTIKIVLSKIQKAHLYHLDAGISFKMQLSVHLHSGEPGGLERLRRFWPSGLALLP